MSEFFKNGRFLGELDDTPDESEIKTGESFYEYDALSSLTNDYLSKESDAKKEEFVLGLRKTLNIPEVSEESKGDIRRFLEKLDKKILGN